MRFLSCWTTALPVAFSCFLTFAWAEADGSQDGHSLFNQDLQALGLLGSHFEKVDASASFDYIVVGGGELICQELVRDWC